MALSSFVWKSSSKLFWGSLFGEGGSFNLTYPSNFSYSLGGAPYICVLSIPTSSGEDLYYLLPMLFQLLFFWLASLLGRNTEPWALPEAHTAKTYNTVSSALYAGRRSSTLVNPCPSELLGSISTLWSPSLCKLHFPRQLILISHGSAYENFLPREVIPISNGFVLASYIELTFAVLQFSLGPLDWSKKHQVLFLGAESSGWRNG